MLIAVSVGMSILMLVGFAFVLTRCWRSVSPDEALLVVTQSEHVGVYRRGAMVLPFVHRAEAIDLRATTLEVGGGARGFRCADRIRVTLTGRFLVAVNPTNEDIVRAARTVGASKAGDPAALSARFGPRFESAIAKAVGELRYVELVKDRAHLEDTVAGLAGSDLDGFALREVHLGEILQVPIEALDPDDILDAEAIRNITEATARENARTAELQREMHQAKAEHDVEADEHVLRIKEEQARREREHAEHVEALKKG